MKPDEVKLRRRLKRSADRMVAARRDRDALIVEATAAGMSRRDVAEAVGLTRAGIQYILDQAREQP
jgi:DNA-binding transcriptional regulator LsrR (DeoR family)